MSEWDALAQQNPAEADRLLGQMKGKIVVPHSGGQQLLIASQARFRVLAAGRRWGKTKISAREMVLEAMKNPGTMNWWVANTYKNVRRGYREIVRQIPRGLLAKEPPPATSNELAIQFKNGASIEFYSAGNPDAMAGEGVNFMVVDEGGLIADDVWFQILRPTLMDSRGRAIIISTPRGRNWFWRLAERGKNPVDAAYEFFHFTGYDNPYIPDEEIDDAREGTPDKLFRQEYLAEFLTNAEAIFNMEKAVVISEIVEPAGQIYMGVDLADDMDFTVISASRADGLPVYHERFQKMGWPTTRARVADAIDDLQNTPGVEGVTVGVDSTGAGDVVYDDLDEAGYDIEPVVFSQQSKDKMVKLLGADLERGRAVLIEEQRQEFEAYEYKITPSGNMTYSAPSGMHDDEVSAKMIEHWVRRHGGPGEVHVMEDPAEEEVDKPAEKIGRATVQAASTRELMNNPDVWERY